MARTTTCPEFSPTRILTTAACERRMPRRALPAGAGRARRRVPHPSRVEGRSPAAIVVAGELEVEALTVHSEGDVPDPGPRVLLRSILQELAHRQYALEDRSPLIIGRPHDLVIHGVETACLLGTLTTACQRR
jgi:hypothetical protein